MTACSVTPFKSTSFGCPGLVDSAADAVRSIRPGHSHQQIFESNESWTVTDRLELGSGGMAEARQRLLCIGSADKRLTPQLCAWLVAATIICLASGQLVA